MVQIKTIVSALLGLSLATCNPIVKRDATTVLADLATINTDLDTLTASVTAYTGGLTGALVVANDESALDTAINKATTDTNASASFSTTESTSVVAAITSLVPKIQNSLTALSAKEPLFDASALDPLVLSLLQTLQSDTDTLGVALQAKAQSTDVATLEGYQTTIDAAFAAAIAVYT